MNDEHGTMNPTTLASDRTESNGGAVHRSSPIVHRSRQKQSGFSLIELIVVVTIIGILAGIAMVNIRYAQQKAREAALKDNLMTLRKAIDNYYADKQKYPPALTDLVPGYIRRIPADPITKQTDWEEVMDDPMSTEGEMSANTDPDAMAEPGVIDVKSRAEGVTLDNVPFNEL